MFRQLEYQERVLNTISTYLDHLEAHKQTTDEIEKLAAANPHLASAMMPRDFVADAWASVKADGLLPASRSHIPHSSRHDGCKRPVPNIVLKVPTGGGKTWLAVSGISKIMGKYLGSNTGFVLWIVPSETIYTQTLKNLRDRQHPYRQALDRAAAGSVLIMEKSDRFNARDVDTHLCIMLLMLQSANRQTRETLKMFQDRGDVHGFFPPEGDQKAHGEVLQNTPNLDGYNDLFPMVKDSLGNALRMIRPVVVMDEGHRAISDLAYNTLYGFNPCFVLELTATPKDIQPRGGKKPREGRYANVLVEVTGKELDREGMIKMPLNLDSRQGVDWRATLNTALDKLNKLSSAAMQLKANTNRHIRPVMLIQVERTGSDQRESGHIHAEDVRNFLLTLGFDEAEIAVKTAEQNDLRQPENQNLMSPRNRVRAIITKQALQEGWDCPFAYVLCSLAASSNLQALTQLVGRILRQPDALKTGIDALDECHVFTHHAETARVVEAVKRGLEQDGLGDLVLQVSGDDRAQPGNFLVAGKNKRRSEFQLKRIYLPLVMFADGNGVRELDYETDILSRIGWRDFSPEKVASRIPDNAQAAEGQLQRIWLRRRSTEPEHLSTEYIGTNDEVLAFDPAHAVRMILDIVPNPFVGREIVGCLLTALRERGFNDVHLGRLARLITEELRKGLDTYRNVTAETIFKRDVESGRIQFRLRIDGENWEMPRAVETAEPEGSRQILGRTGGPLQKSLFSPVYENEFNSDEREIAVYLDGESALVWWHRNVARRQYGIQGWKKAKIYPDFIFAVHQQEDKTDRITILETKGDQLDNNIDTDYKRQLLAFLSENFCWENARPVGKLEMLQKDGDTVHCELVLMNEWKSRLPEFFRESSVTRDIT